jgi:hypothetical protein
MLNVIRVEILTETAGKKMMLSMVRTWRQLPAPVATLRRGMLERRLMKSRQMNRATITTGWEMISFLVLR